MIELDSPGEVRKSEELNNLNLSFYLKKKLGSSKTPLVINQFKKGFSNLTYSIIWDKNEYVLRKPPFGANIKSGHDMRREYNVLSNLSKYLSVSLLEISSCGEFGFINSLALLAAALPKTTKSIKELEPNLFAPCTETHAASPIAISPGTTLSLPFEFITSAL